MFIVNNKKAGFWVSHFIMIIARDRHGVLGNDGIVYSWHCLLASLIRNECYQKDSQ